MIKNKKDQGNKTSKKIKETNKEKFNFALILILIGTIVSQKKKLNGFRENCRTPRRTNKHDESCASVKSGKKENKNQIALHANQNQECVRS